MNYYKRHLGDYARKAGHLTMLEHGAYTLLLDAYYEREQGPTLAEAMRIARARTDEERAAVAAVLTDFFTPQPDGRYRQQRVQDEFCKAEAQASINLANGKKGGRPRKPKGNPTETGRVISDNRSESEKNPNPLIHQSTNPLKAKSGATARGSRLPNNWTATAEQGRWARAERPDLNIARECDAFRDYWIGCAGAKGVKLDWDATFRNWIRRATGPRFVNASDKPVNTAGSSPPVPVTKQSQREANEAVEKLAREMGHDVEAIKIQPKGKSK